MNAYLRKNTSVFILILLILLSVQISILLWIFFKAHIFDLTKKLFSILFLVLSDMILSICFSHFYNLKNLKKFDTLIAINRNIYMEILSFLLILFSYIFSYYMLFTRNVSYISPQFIVPSLVPLFFLTYNDLSIGDKFLVYGFKILELDSIYNFYLSKDSRHIIIFLKDGSNFSVPVYKKLYDKLVKKYK